MKKLIFLFTFSAGVLSLEAQTFSPKSGDKELDLNLSELNAGAKLDLKGFKAEMNLSFNCGNQKVEELLVTMEPSDVFMLLQIAQLQNKSHDVIIASWKRNKKGWGAVAKDMGIKPGSPAFKALKDGAKGKNTNMKTKAKAKKAKMDMAATIAMTMFRKDFCASAKASAV